MLNPLGLPFSYLPLERVRQEGFSSTDFPDAVVRRLGVFVAGLIHRYTQCVFFPYRDQIVISSLSGSILGLPNYMPIRQVDAVEYGFGSSWSSIDPSYFQVKGRTIVSLAGEFPQGRGQVRISGTFGGFENLEWKDPEVTTTASAGRGASSLAVSASPAWLLGEVGISNPIGYLPDAVPFLVNSVSGTSVAVEPLIGPIGNAAPVQVVGRVPEAVFQAALVLMRDYAGQMGAGIANNRGKVYHPGLSDPNRLSSESTGDTSWSMDLGLVSNTQGTLSSRCNTTGNLLADSLLVPFLNNEILIGLV